MKKLVFVVFLLVFSISCKKENNILYSQKFSIEFFVNNYAFITHNYEQVYMNKINNNGKTDFNGIFVGENIEYQKGKIISKINKKLFVIILDNKGDVKNIFRLRSPVFHCDCPDDDNPLNYCEDYTDEKGRLRCRGGASCCEGYLTDDVNNQIKYMVNNGIIVTCDKLVYSNKVYQ